MARPHYLQASGEDWQKARMRALVRDDFKCQAHQLGLCDEPCDETRLNKLVVHHIKWRIHGGDHSLDNLLTICHHHHEGVHPHLKFAKYQDVAFKTSDDDDPYAGFLFPPR